MTPIVDICCGSRMFWFDKQNSIATFVDKRIDFEKLPTGHVINVDPDVQADFTKGLPFHENTFYLAVFDPPHLIHAGKNSWLAKKYGTLDADNWPEIIREGFDEAMRVLKPYGTLIFKWNDSQIPLPDLLKQIPYQPLFGQKRSQTHWLVFMKGADIVSKDL
ncbi:SAM-dependent methyltransferase [Oenococcus sicerae]|uniref:SAM-dependent methyltransferase n=1 Tax=Oenococcus sicerae TaxID=2203724 RepID=A0ABX5QNE5_9LACO|nr:SAM-dependent methyltransferase [Oenococcus sicerae]QAS70241.1 SAM-dependent methyltransferase [Oenococcus sicerae]